MTYTEFIPSDEWQEVPDNAICPPGLEYRMGLDDGGKKHARRQQPANPIADPRTIALLAHLGRGGRWQYYTRFHDNSGGRTFDKKMFSVDAPGSFPDNWNEVYFNVNPLKDIPEGRGTIQDIAAVNCLYGEFDIKEGATREKIAALDPGPNVVVFSGGGWHCYWLLKDPVIVTDDNRDELKRIQGAWVARVGSDGAAKDLARVLRVPGSYNKKPERKREDGTYPQVTFLRAEFEVLYPLDYLAGLLPLEAPRAAKPAAQPIQPATAPTVNPGERLPDNEWARALLARLNRARCDNRGDWVNVGLSLSAVPGGFELWDAWSKGSAKYDAADCVRVWNSFKPGSGLTIGSLYAWANEDDPFTPTRAAAVDPVMPEMPEDWDQQAPPEDIDTNGQPATGQPTQARTAAQGAPTAQPANISTRFSTFADLEGAIGPVEFAWSVWLPDGMLTILASESGVGKSLLIMRVCGCFLLELPWPDGTPFTGEPGSVLWCEAEAAQSINLERAKAWGYPLDKIILPFEDPLTDVNLDNLAHQAAITQKAQMPEVRLIVVDSLSGSTSKKENDTEIKKITEFLARMARDTGKPVILTHHLNKAIFGNTEVTMDRLRGSTAIVQHARVIWALDCPNQTTPENKRLKMIKNNLRKFAAPIGVTATDKGLIFGAAPTAPRDLSQLEQAQALLQELLADGPVKSKTIEAAADAKGISWRTVNQAKKNMGIIDRREGGGKGSGITWQFPEASDDTL